MEALWKGEARSIPLRRERGEDLDQTRDQFMDLPFCWGYGDDLELHCEGCCAEYEQEQIERIKREEATRERQLDSRARRMARKLGL